MAGAAPAPRMTVLLVPDGDPAWENLRTRLQPAVGADEVLVARGEREAVYLANAHRPTLVLMAPSIDGQSTHAVVPILRSALGPSATIAVCASEITVDQAAEFARVGASGCLLHSDLASHAIETILGVLMHPPVVVHSRRIWDAMVRELMLPRAGVEQRTQLTSRELLVLWALADGLTQKEVAARESISPRTVRRIVKELQQKLRAPTPFALGLRAVQLGIFMGPDRPRASGSAP